MRRQRQRPGPSILALPPPLSASFSNSVGRRRTRMALLRDPHLLLSSTHGIFHRTDVCKMFEAHLKDAFPTAPKINYKPADLFAFIDRLSTCSGAIGVAPRAWRRLPRAALPPLTPKCACAHCSGHELPGAQPQQRHVHASQPPVDQGQGASWAGPSRRSPSEPYAHGAPSAPALSLAPRCSTCSPRWRASRLLLARRCFFTMCMGFLHAAEINN